MKNAKSISFEALASYQESYDENKLAHVMSNALNKNAISSIAVVPSALTKDQMNFSIDIETMACANQKASGRCWLFAGLNVLREIVAKKCNIKEFELSQNYTAFFDKFEKINYFLESVIDLADRSTDDRTLNWILRTGVQDGGQWDMLVSVIKKYGLVPKSAMEETCASSATRDMNGLINTKLRQYASKIQKMYADGKTREQLRDEKEDMLKEMYVFLCTCFGVPPQTFDFEYVDKDKQYHLEKGLTPKSFYETYVGDMLDDYVSIIHAPTKDKPFNKKFTVSYLGNVVGGNDICYLNVDMDTFKDLVIKQLKDREIVWFGSDCGKFSNRDNGVWDDQAFDYESAFGMSFEMSKEDMLDYAHSAMNHAMVITGVNLDQDKPTKWKIENSWGDGAGQKGYFVMSDSWFSKYVYQAVIHKKYLSDSLTNALNEAPIVLKPWDPMGTLAD